MNITDFNTRWLQAWTNKNVDALLAFYAADATYIDQQVPHGLTGHDQLRAYLTGLFAATPPMRYEPEEIWPIAGGFCGRWYCTIGEDPSAKPALRGFDLVLLRGETIALNEVYTHPLPSAP
ncbi:MAG: DUF4440 domain-containing protein [Alphaproteobacteria bacterium]|nr:DUF4440 domain-containing protein [Alphaproteobacteria bacterium]